MFDLPVGSSFAIKIYLSSNKNIHHNFKGKKKASSEKEILNGY
jgi:hypothetical protein